MYWSVHNIAQMCNPSVSIVINFILIVYDCVISCYINCLHCCHLIWAEILVYEYSIPKKTSYPWSANEYPMNPSTVGVAIKITLW